MKKYYFTWFNNITQKYHTNFISAIDETEAKQIAVLIMRFVCGKAYTVYSIIEMEEVTDALFRDMDYVKNLYHEFGYEFDLPDINDPKLW